MQILPLDPRGGNVVKKITKFTDEIGIGVINQIKGLHLCTCMQLLTLLG